MRTTVDIPEQLFRQTKAEAALQGKSLKRYITDALLLAIQKGKSPRKTMLDNAPDDVKTEERLTERTA